MIICIEDCITGRIKLIDTTIRDWIDAFDIGSFSLTKEEATLVLMSVHFHGKTVQNGRYLAYKYCIKHLTGKEEKTKKKKLA